MSDIETDNKTESTRGRSGGARANIVGLVAVMELAHGVELLAKTLWSEALTENRKHPAGSAVPAELVEGLFRMVQQSEEVPGRTLAIAYAAASNEMEVSDEQFDALLAHLDAGIEAEQARMTRVLATLA